MDDVSLQARQSHRLAPGLHDAMRNPAAWRSSGARARASKGEHGPQPLDLVHRFGHRGPTRPWRRARGLPATAFGPPTPWSPRRPGAVLPRSAGTRVARTEPGAAYRGTWRPRAARGLFPAVTGWSQRVPPSRTVLSSVGARRAPGDPRRGAPSRRWHETRPRTPRAPRAAAPLARCRQRLRSAPVRYGAGELGAIAEVCEGPQ